MAATRLILQNIGGVFCNQIKPVTKRLLNKNIWNKHISRRYARGYEGDGKTVGFILNKKDSLTFCIDNVYTDGFMLSNGTHLAGSIIIFPHSIMSWHILRAKDVNEDALVLFKILEPKIDLLIFGYGSKEAYTPLVRKQFTESCKKVGLRFEALPTEQACGVFNFMSDERRFIAAALIPPLEIDVLRLEETKSIYIDEGEEKEEMLREGYNQKIGTKYLK